MWVWVEEGQGFDKMKETLKLIGVLSAICIVSGLLLAQVERHTKGPIEEARRREKLDALNRALPPHDNQPDSDAVTVTDGKVGWLFYVATLNGAYAGTAFECSSRNGYGGEITIMAGIDPSSSIPRLEILSQNETPGLGAKIEGAAFLGQFSGRTAERAQWCGVLQDGGEIAAITGATISSRAVCEALRRGLDAFQRNRAVILAGPRNDETQEQATADERR